MLGEIRAMQVYTMTWKNSKKYLHSTIFYKYKIVLWKFFYADSKIRAVQIRAMRNRASRGMTVPVNRYTYNILYGRMQNFIISFNKIIFYSLKNSCYANSCYEKPC